MRSWRAQSFRVGRRVDHFLKGEGGARGCLRARSSVGRVVAARERSWSARCAGEGSEEAERRRGRTPLPEVTAGGSDEVSPLKADKNMRTATHSRASRHRRPRPSTAHTRESRRSRSSSSSSARFLQAFFRQRPPRSQRVDPRTRKAEGNDADADAPAPATLPRRPPRAPPASSPSTPSAWGCQGASACTSTCRADPGDMAQSGARSVSEGEMTG